MKLIWDYMKLYWKRITSNMSIKLIGTMCELSLPYILEHIIDDIVPLGSVKLVVYWGLFMTFMAFVTRFLNVTANRLAVRVAADGIKKLRYDLFTKTSNLSGTRFDSFGLASLTSRMTSDSYNVQNFMARVQTMAVRAPIMLIGGIILTLTMDAQLALVLIIMLPILMGVVLFISNRGIPLFDRVQSRVDDVVRIMRENISGIRVVKALSREDHEMDRYKVTNDALAREDIHANRIMAIPGPFMEICLNVGLSIVVLLGAVRVDNGAIEPGVILAFLTYFNVILQAVMGLNRIFVMISKATASADRIALVLSDAPDQLVLDLARGDVPEDVCIRFDHVSFNYFTPAGSEDESARSAEAKGIRSMDKVSDQPIDRNELEKEEGRILEDISFDIKRGQSLGIIGQTGSGKTTIINLLMRFYDATEGCIYVDGRDVRSYEKDGLRNKFGVVFQNDIIFADSIYGNIDFERGLSYKAIRKSADDSGASEFIDRLEGGYEFKAAIHGANLSGGQKQRIMISRALAGDPKILILDDSSSALDYKTDAALRKAIREDYGDATTIMIAQRVSSVMSCNNILVLDDGRMVAYGTHDELLESCELYRKIFEHQMKK
ncbi:ATP-binding cassette, subfamily B [Butyrivibrio fibrisolvens DSM 3071]|uniref:ATP-binding cassette, subfamily B n=1 Tax=Butyrivibrio fibrisolvens DSM 3071 TaxID=1121131 RepID=A0A1M5QK45_BUTFI|nr:ABC transporter ATP-binding protein [Butyrivibrio fibrisolvens]SHH14286.1 ATP-binding cassette, subfamily B [Butyrivibrio fibrisolvens DSM 3071]